MRKAVMKVTAGIGAMAVLAGCAMEPRGPSVRVFPAPYKPFEVFEQDQAECEDYAHRQIAGAAQDANNRALGAAAIGTGLGLALGAATGSGRGAAFGAAAGGAVGTTIGAGQSDRANFSLQRRYDIAYSECMYSKGNQVPGYASSYPPPLPPRRGAPPPPPPGRGYGPVPGGPQGNYDDRDYPPPPPPGRNG
jgi:uncharacterized protein YcfJ